MFSIFEIKDKELNLLPRPLMSLFIPHVMWIIFGLLESNWWHEITLRLNFLYHLHIIQRNVDVSMIYVFVEVTIRFWVIDISLVKNETTAKWLKQKTVCKNTNEHTITFMSIILIDYFGNIKYPTWKNASRNACMYTM